MITVIDYGMGNLHSVRKALEVSGADVKVSSMPSDIKKAKKIVFPGVGAFGEAMKELERRRLVEPIKEAISGGRPFLGLCLGLQLLFEKSEEAPGVRGLGVLKGDVKRFRFASCVGRRACERLKVPHMGWNSIKIARHKTQNTRIMKGIPDNTFMYFVHSYYVVPADKRDVLAATDYGIKFAAGIARDNIYALQFHPEKSQEMGLRILRNFVRL